MKRVCDTPKCSDFQLSISKSVTWFFFGSRIGALTPSVSCAAPTRLTLLIILSLSKVSPKWFTKLCFFFSVSIPVTLVLNYLFPKYHSLFQLFRSQVASGSLLSLKSPTKSMYPWWYSNQSHEGWESFVINAYGFLFYSQQMSLYPCGPFLTNSFVLYMTLGFLTQQLYCNFHWLGDAILATGFYSLSTKKVHSTILCCSSRFPLLYLC